MRYLKRFNEGLELYDKVSKAVDLYSDLVDRKDVNTYDLDVDIQKIVGMGNPDWYKLDEETIDNLLELLKSY
jgi:hypothetical protein